MAEPLRERIDMAVLGPNPGFVRVSVRLSGLGLGQARKAASAAALLRRVSERAQAAFRPDDPRLAAWRAAYANVGLEPDTVPPPEALVAWAAAPGGVPSQGGLCDLVNAYALQHMLPAAAYDLDGIQGDVWLRPSRGNEHFDPVGGGPPESPPINELILADSRDRVMARRWHGAQGRPAAAGPRTRDALVHLDLLPPLAGEAEALADGFARLVSGFLGGRAEWRLLTRSEPQAGWSDARS